MRNLLVALIVFLLNSPCYANPLNGPISSSSDEYVPSPKDFSPIVSDNQGVAPLPPFSITPQLTANFNANNGNDNSGATLGVNNILSLNGGLVGATEVPATVTNSWALVVRFKVDPLKSWNGQTPAIILGKCAASNCTGGNDRALSLTMPEYNFGAAGRAPLTIDYQAQVSGSANTFWKGVAAKSVAITAGSGYTDGVYTWVGTGGTCAREPAGVTTVTGGKFTTSTWLTDSGECQNGSAPTVSLPSGAGAGTGGAITLTMSSTGGDWAGSGIMANPGENVVCWIIQYGQEAANVTAGINGWQAMACNDADTGNALTGSPSISETTNQDSTVAGFYYSAASTKRTQAAILDIAQNIGNPLYAAATYEKGFGSFVGDVGMFYGIFPNSAGTPDATDLSDLAAGVTDIKSFMQTNGTCHSLYKLNDSGTWADSCSDNGGSPFADATASGTVAAGTPIGGAQCLKLNEVGNGYVFDHNGTFNVSGTYDQNSCGGALSAVDVQISNSPGGTAISGYGWQTCQNRPSGGTFSCALTAPPVGGPYYVSVRPDNGQSFVYNSAEGACVGMVVGFWAQSQGNYLFSSQTGNLALSGSAPVGCVSVLGLLDQIKGPSDSLNSGNNNPESVAAVRLLDSTNVAGASSDVLGAGAVALINAIVTNTATSGWPVMLVDLTKPGQASDQFAFGNYATSVSLSGSGTGPYSASLDIGTASSIIANANYYTGNSYLSPQTVKHGTIAVRDSTGATIATDTPDGTRWGTTAADTGTLTGSGVTGGTVNYLAGGTNGVPSIASLDFSSTPSCPCTVSFTEIQDTIASNPTQQSPYVGWDVFGSLGDSTSGLVAKVLAAMHGPFSVEIVMQYTANEGEFNGALPQTTGYNSQTAKWNYVLQTRLASWAYNATRPILIAGYSRDVEVLSSSSYYEPTNGRWFTQNYGASGGSFAYGGSYADVAVQCSGTGACASPHENNTVLGGQRMGTRLGLNVVGADQASNVAQQSTITSLAFDGDYAHIKGTVTLVHGTKLATCGTAMGTNGSCTVTTALSTACNGFQVTEFTDSNHYLVFQDGYDQIHNTFYPADAFTCTLNGDNTFELTKTSGVWQTALTNVTYLAGAPFGRTGTQISVAIATSGSGYSSTGTATITGCTGATTNPTISYTASGGALATVSPLTPGAGMTANCTGKAVSGGTSGTVNITVGSATSDLNDDGESLYDNSGATGANEPGLPITPMPSATAVSG